MFFKNIPDKEVSFVKDILKSYCLSDYGKKFVDSLKPFTDLESIIEEIEKTKYGELVYDKHKNLDTQPVPFINDIINKLNKIDYLSEEECGKIYLTLKTVEYYIKSFFNLGLFEKIFSFYEECIKTLEVVNYLSKLFSLSGTIKTDATDILREIHNKKEEVKQKIHEKIDFLMKTKKKYLQEQFFVFRDGRYVLPVKAGFKKDLNGIVRDSSHSGDTLYIEPFELIDLNDKLFLIQKDEEKEKIKILKEVTHFLKSFSLPILCALKNYGYWDFILAKIKYKRDYMLNFPSLEGENIYIKSAIHPMLVKKSGVSNDFILENDKKLLLITGPNGGGKTVALKTLASIYVLTYMAIPTFLAKDSKIKTFKRFYFDIIDIQDIEQGVSSFTSKMILWKEILENADNNTLVVIDEMGSFTNPNEGAAISCAFLEQLINRGATAFVGTHIDQIKEYFSQKSHCKLASFLWDEKTYKPTYKVAYNVYSSSYAIDVLKSLNFDSQFIDKCCSFLNSDFINVKKLSDIYKCKVLQLEKNNKELEELKRELKDVLELKKEFLKSLKIKVLDLERDYKDRISELMKKYDEVTSNSKNHDEKRKLIEDLKREGEELFNIYKVLLPKHRETFNVGETVYIKSINRHAKVVDVQKNKVVVVLDGKKLSYDKSLLYEPIEHYSYSVQSKNSDIVHIEDQVSNVIDLKGLKVDEAIRLLDKFIDNAYLSGLDKIKIIHGAGKGRLKEHILNYLKKDRRVKKIKPCDYSVKGGGYTTEVEL